MPNPNEIEAWVAALIGPQLEFLLETFPFHAVAQQLTWFSLGYFLLMNGVYVLLCMVALFSVQKTKDEGVLDTLPQLHTELQLPVSILVPAFNEAVTVVSSVRSLLQLSYGEYEVIVINDGSTDGTLRVLQRAFELVPLPAGQPSPLETQPVRQAYQSARYPRLRVIDKANGGKADSLNAGINFARYPLFCGVDADSVLERDSLQKVVAPFTRDPRVIASGGTVRVANGCQFRDGRLASVALPRNVLAKFQLVEYVRAFFLTRVGWTAINAVLIVSGAFGVFRKDVVTAAGGYMIGTIGEDMELVVRLHKVMKASRRDYRVVYSPEPVCWTEAPEDLRTLRNQRIRWQRGLGESLASNWGLLASPRGGVAGHVAFPFLLLFELAGPAFELFGYVSVAVFWLAGWVSGEAYLLFLLVAVGLGVILSLCGLLMQELTFHIYSRRQLLVLGLFAVLENFGYRQLNVFWRLTGLWRWLSQSDAHWGTMRRRGAWQIAR